MNHQIMNFVNTVVGFKNQIIASIVPIFMNVNTATSSAIATIVIRYSGVKIVIIAGKVHTSRIVFLVQIALAV